jgi:hypothetical protein
VSMGIARKRRYRQKIIFFVVGGDTCHGGAWRESVARTLPSQTHSSPRPRVPTTGTP